MAAAAPGLAQTTNASVGLFPQLGLTGRCVSGVLVPAGDTPITIDPNDPGNLQPNIREFFYGLTNLAGQGASFDGNGPYLALQGGGGEFTNPPHDGLVTAPNPGGGFQNSSVYGHTIAVPQGVQPALPAKKPPIRSDVPCYQNALPGINGPAAAVAPPDLTPVP